MKNPKYKYSLNKVYRYCRWEHDWPPNDWCILGISMWWIDYKLIDYRLCFFGFELRFRINRILIQ
jgi:hypothetical protein